MRRYKNVHLPPDRFLYDRKGPWPQPSPSHPLVEAPAVLNIPPEEWLVWNSTIGARYLITQMGQPPLAAKYANGYLSYKGPNKENFDRILLETAHSRFLRKVTEADVTRLHRATDRIRIDLENGEYNWLKMDFQAMDLVEPLDGLYSAPCVVFFREHKNTGKRESVAIELPKCVALPRDPAWTLAQVYALQGASYHMLFVVHPALHFPMDSVNAITKTAVPMNNPIFQLIHPHTTYSLALNNAVLEGEKSVVNKNAQGTWYDPLTADGYNLKLLFGVGYTGVRRFREAYPAFDYMNPQMGTWKGVTSPYLQALEAYYKPFQDFATFVAKTMLGNRDEKGYARRWGNYLHAHLKGFPTGRQLANDAEMLGRALAIYMWDVSVSHGADHYSFGTQVGVVDKMLRIRIPPPESHDEPFPEGKTIGSPDDLYRASLCQQMFFLPFSIQPDLAHTGYPLLDNKCFLTSVLFQKTLRSVESDLRGKCKHGTKGACCFQPLTPVAPDDDPKHDELYPKPIGHEAYYKRGPFDPKLSQLTIPATIQY